MADREKKKQKQKYRNLNILRTKRAFYKMKKNRFANFRVLSKK